jgi:uncharacterized protein YkwD
MRYLLLILVVFVSLTQPAVKTEALTKQQYCYSNTEQQLLKLVNEYRRSHGVQALRPMQSLGAAAEHHSRSMAREGYFAHNLVPEGISWSTNITNHGYNYNAWLGENIAAGQKTPREVFNAWKNSPSHNQTMLSDKFTAIGLGHVVDYSSDYKVYWTMDVAGVYKSGIKKCT